MWLHWSAGTCGCLSIAIAGVSDYTPDIWTLGTSFNKRIDLYSHGHPDRPPTLELIFLSWNLGQLTVIGDFHNPTTVPLRVEGYLITDSDGMKNFYPRATLEVSDAIDSHWQSIGMSPSVIKNVETMISVPPDSRPQRTGHLHFVVNLDPFRRVIGKAKYCRVVLSDGQSSQILALTDLLPDPDDQFWKVQDR